ncbi:MAG: glycosyltransferase family 39 protein [Chloroflexota bacterium]
MYLPSVIAWAMGLLIALLAALPREMSVRREAGSALSRLWTFLRTGEGIAACAILIAGAALRLFDLEGIPSGIHGDEAEFALLALPILSGEGPAPFGTAFLGDPALFLYVEAPFLALCGQTMTAIRFVAALSGTLTLLAFYVLVRSMFGARPGLLALSLLAGSAVHIHFSRLAINSPQVPLLMCLASCGLWRAAETRRAFWWMASGVLGALAVYFHFAGRLFPLVMALFILYLLTTRRGQWLDWVKGSATGLLGGAITLAPMAVHLAHNPQLFTGHMTDRLIFTNWDAMVAAHRTSSVPLVLWEQTRLNLMAFISGMNGASFYPFPGQAMMAPFLWPLFVLGLVLMLARFGDKRYALLALSFWTVVIINGILTINAPQPHRLLPALPMALIGVAMALDGIIAMGSRLLGSATSPAFFGAAALFTLAAGYVDDAYYFGPGTALKPWENVTTQAKYVAGLGPSYRVFTLGAPHVYFRHGNTRYLAPNVEGDNLLNPAATLPVAVPADHDLAFLVYPQLAGYLPLIQTTYPSGRTETVAGRTGTIFTTVLVPRSEIGRWQGLTAHFGHGDRIESDLSQLGGGTLSYPAPVVWSGSIYISRSGPHSFRTDGVPAELSLDGTPISAGRAVEVSAGWHALAIKATMNGPEERVSLSWQSPGQRMSLVPTHLVDARDLAGSLSGRLEPEGEPAILRRDRGIGFRSLGNLTDVRKPTTMTWEGTLNVSQAGVYGFTLNSTGEAEVSIDGKRILANPSADSRFHTVSTESALSQGSHSISIRHHWRQSPGILELLWTPPGGHTSVIPPERFGPPRN